MDVCCASGAPVTSDYKSVGSFVEIGDTKCYVTGQNSDKGIIAIYDIFGFDYPQFQQVCDHLAAAGFVVAAPDVFRGKPWTLDKFPPKPEDNLMGWIQSYPWEKVSKDVHAAIEVLKAKGVTKFGSAGWCWGAAMAVQAAAEPTFSATAFLHPSLFGKEEEWCAVLDVPLITLSTPGDPLDTIKEVMDAKGDPLAAKCVYKLFENQIHGFCGARGDFSNAETAKCVGEAIAMVSKFFADNL